MSDHSEGDHGKEAILDYELSWVLRICAEKRFANTLLQKYCLGIMSKLLYGEADMLRQESVRAVRVWKQWSHIDVVAEIELSDNSFYVLIVENKAYTRMTEQQRDVYPTVIEEWYSNKPITPIYRFCVISLFEGDEELFAELKEFAEQSGRWIVYPLNELCHAELGLTGSDLFDEFWIKPWRRLEK